MRSEHFSDYLWRQIDVLSDLAYDIENGNLHNSEAILGVDLDKLNGYLNGDFDLEE